MLYRAVLIGIAMMLATQPVHASCEATERLLGVAALNFKNIDYFLFQGVLESVRGNGLIPLTKQQRLLIKIAACDDDYLRLDIIGCNKAECGKWQRVGAVVKDIPVAGSP